MITPAQRRVADTTRGFLPTSEAEALHAAALRAPAGPLLEVGSYCGKSTVWLGSAAAARGGVLVTVDHHRGSEEHQPGWQYHDPGIVDPVTGRIDTLPHLRATLAAAGLEEAVVVVVGSSPVVAATLTGTFALVFIDGGHTDAAAAADYRGWAPQLVPGGLLAIHDVFPDPRDGGQAPHRIWRAAIASGDFVEESVTGSLHVARRRTRGPTAR